MYRIPAHGIALLLLSSPVWAADPTADYKCSDGTSLVASFKNSSEGPGSVSLYFPKSETRIELPQGMSADGGRYVSGETVFWIKGNQATFTRNGRDVTCQTKP